MGQPEYVKVKGEAGLFLVVREQVSRSGATSVYVQRVNKAGMREEYRAFRPERLRRKRVVRFVDQA